MRQNSQRVTKDRFGNDTIVVGMKDKKGNGFPRGFAEINRQLYKIEVSASKKDGVECWVKITKLQKQTKQNF